jgi:hypothetical protein
VPFYYWIDDPEKEGHRIGVVVDDDNFVTALTSGELEPVEE